jgi:rod shape-determining protein MreC
VALTLQDLNSRVPVLVQRSRVRGMVTGNNGPMLGLEFIPKDVDIALDDLLLTSGTGGVFPKGLVVGRIVSISPKGDGLFQAVVVRPAVDASRAEEVRLLLPAEESPDVPADTGPSRGAAEPPVGSPDSTSKRSGRT